jgi:Bacterial Ig domain/WD40-like Beta Propeller Repeat
MLKARLALASFIGVACLLAPATAGATAPPGPNGDLAFTSGRTPNTDATAKIWVVGQNGGTATQVTTTSGQNRQPNWSPDHTKIAYALVSGGNTSIRVLDMSVTPNTDTEFVAAAAVQDRPTWSPDGTKIAYGSGGKIFVKPYPSGAAVAVTNGTSDERPVWSPDGNTIYYNHTVTASLFDIVKKSPVTLLGTETPVVTGAANDWQPAVSPDGSRLCFLRGPKDNGADLWLANTSGTDSGLSEFANDPGGLGSLNCVWSPDGTQIAYTQGAFTQGQLVKKAVGSSSTSAPSPITGVASVFDGNADWAVNFRPVCQNATLSVARNGFVTVPLGCTDRDSDADNISRDIVDQPQHGNLGGIDNNSNTVIYTPATNFTGTDTFTFKGFDGNTDSSPATITLNVGSDSNGNNGNGKDVTAARIDSVSMSRRAWRRGSALPSFVSRARVGTTISYRLSEKARATLTFSRRAKGRKVGRRCRKPTRKNRTRRRCNRFVKAGTLQLDSKAGTNRLKFQGRLSRGKRLKVGRYRLVVGAKDSAGNVSKRSKPVSFRIVRR